MVLSRQGDWPLILCGPMLRRVTPDLVSVFIALSSPARVTLKVQTLADAANDTVALGKYLHVCLVEAAASPTPLQRGQIYHYDVEIVGVDGVKHTLKTENLLDGDYPLGYAADALPGFCLAQNLAQFKLIHGSCRLPHGDGWDMLALLDGMIGNARDDPAQRPHQLALTGDQIYADDVDPCLLATLTDLGRRLLDWSPHETIPYGRGDRALTLAATADIPLRVAPPLGLCRQAYRVQHDDVIASTPASRQQLGDFCTRAEFVYSQTDLTSGSADCHLLFLGEFYTMYLLAWSDALWSSAALAGQAAPDAIKSLVETVLPEPAPDWLMTGIARSKYSRDLAGYRDGARQSLARLLRYARTTPQVRRALANIPSAMIFDDHEVTDDWYINGWWQRTILGNPAGRRVVRNAMLAYAVFQDWGNRPEDYRDAGAAAGNAFGVQLLDSLRWQENAAPAIATDPARVDQLLGMTSAAAAQRKLWHYVLPGPGCQFLFMDSRTWRAFPADPGMGDQGPAELISADALTAQLALPQRSAQVLTIVIAGTPVFGSSLIEAGQEVSARAKAGGWAEYDFESWGANRTAHKRLLRALAQFRCVVVLSGDVHYAFVNQAALALGGPPRSARIVQLCSSALMNHSGPPMTAESKALSATDPCGALGLVDDELPNWDETALRALLEVYTVQVQVAEATAAPEQLLAPLREMQMNLKRVVSLRRGLTVVADTAESVAAVRNVLKQLRLSGKTGWSYRVSTPPIAYKRFQLSGNPPGPADSTDTPPIFALKLLGHNNIAKVEFGVGPAGPVNVKQTLFYDAYQHVAGAKTMLQAFECTALLTQPDDAEWDAP